ncbi:hypothetical protein AGIG_G4257 [Arapaima gigas]
MRAMTRVQENVSPRDCSSRTVATGRRERAAPPAGRNGHFDAAPAATEQAVVVARARARSSLGGPVSVARAGPHTFDTFPLSCIFVCNFSNKCLHCTRQPKKECERTLDGSSSKKQCISAEGLIAVSPTLREDMPA